MHQRTRPVNLLLIALLLLSLAPAAAPAAAQSDALYGPFISQTFGTGEDNAQAIALGDLDGDGDLDAAVANFDQLSMVYLNDGAGSFAPGIPFGAPGQQSIGIALGDVDGDGDLDIALANFGFQSAVYLNDGTAGFSSGPPTCDPAAGVRCFGEPAELTTSVALGDLNGDGSLDLVVGRFVAWNGVFFNDGFGSFSVETPLDLTPGSLISMARTVAVDDLNNDGSLDIILGNYLPPSGNIPLPDEYLLNDGQGGFGVPLPIGPEVNDTETIAVGDLNGDGRLDIVMAGYFSRLIYFANESGFAYPITLPTSANIRSLAIGDVDADGDLDILTVSFQNTPMLLLNYDNGDFMAAVGVLFTAIIPATSVVMGDLDGNGYLDVVIANENLSHHSYLNGGARLYEFNTPESAVPFGSGANTTFSLAHGDFNGDGLTDIVAGSLGQSFVYLNNGDGDFPNEPAICGQTEGVRCFGPATNIFGLAAYAVAVADVNLDGAPDIVANSTFQQAVYLNDGVGNFVYGNAECGARVICFGPDNETSSALAVADVNEDSFPDLIFGASNGQSAVFLNRPDLVQRFGEQARFFSGFFTCGASPGVQCLGEGGLNVQGVTTGDIDSDGQTDIVMAIANGGARVYFNDGQGGFAYNLPDCTNDQVLSCLGANIPYANKVAVSDFDNDGRQDVVLVTLEQSQDYIFYNRAGNGRAIHWEQAPIGSPNSQSTSVEIGDLNGDSTPDIVIGVGRIFNQQSFNAIYFNQGGAFYNGNLECTTPNQMYLCFGNGDSLTTDVMIANTDENQSGGSDVIFGGLGLPVTILLNDTGQFVSQRFAGPGGDALRALDTGDIDGDGAQDVLIGNYGPPSGVSYANGRGGYTATQPFGGPGLTTDVALGDLDGDGDLDAALADPIQSRVYLNQGGRFAPGITGCDAPAAVRCFGGGFVPITAIALGDVNGDGSLDIAAAITNGQSLVYLNDGQGNFAATSPIGPSVGQAQAVAYGDVDRDGDLDLAIGANDGFNAVYLNDGAGGFPNGAVDCASIGVRCFGVASTALSDIDIGDVNGDGALDIAVANNARQSLAYLNDGRGGFVSGEIPCSNPQVACIGRAERSSVIGLGDLDADGDMDAVLGNIGSHGDIYVNNNNVFEYVRGIDYWRINIEDFSLSDMDKDGTVDILTGSSLAQNVIYRDLRFRGARLPNQPVTVAVERPGAVAAPADGASPEVLGEPLIPVRYRLFDPEGGTVAQVRAFFSLDGGGSWAPAVPAAGTPTTNLAASPEGTAHTFTWDTFASGVFGQSDRVVLRFVAANGPAATAYGPPGTVRYTRQAAGPTQYPAGVGTTPPFRVRGTQVQVRQENGAPAASALVYRIPAGERRGGAPLSAGSGEAFRTSPLGTLPGRGQLGIGDRLVALYPITATDTYTIYLTSAAPTADGLQSQTVAAPGVQTLTVSPANPLVLLNLDVALEWDAREDRAFVEQLRFDLQRAAELLYDWSDGQVTLGAIRIFHDREHWDDAHIRIYATNRLRPNANQGGIIAEPLADPDRPALIYEPGQVRMGAVWNRYGEVSGNLGEDWPRTLAHELGHFALFLDDNYLGLDPAGRLIAVTGCRGAMSDPYRADYGEFHPPGAAWDAACSATLSERTTGRADWETIRRFYDRPELGVALNQPAAFGANPGPNILPLAVTQITEMPLGREISVVDVPIFSLTEGGARMLPGPTARAFLFPHEGDRIVDLGQPVLDQVTARGARPGDRLCVYEAGAARLGCEVVSEGDDTLDLQVLAGEAWSPDIRVTPVTSRTIDLRVANVPAGLTLQARLYATAAAPGQSPPTITLTEATGVYTGRFTLDDPTLDGVIQVWAEGGVLRESITDFALGGNPGFRRARNAPRGSPGFRRARNAPAVSTDGQVILFSDNLQFDEGEFFTVQPATRLPAPPAGRSLVGQGYWLSASAGAPDLAGVSINLGYLSRDVPPGAEDGIGLYHWDGIQWRALDTASDAVRNEASAVITGPGIYVLMTSITLPLTGPGWNLIASPARGTLPIREALASIEGFYTLVYGYAPDDRTDPWRVYAPDAPTWVSDLESLEFGKGYWINASESITLYLPVGDARAQARDTRQPAAASLPAPPATYYGAAPGVGLTVEASVNGQLCGQSQTVERELRGQLRPTFVVNVRAADTGTNAGCGTPGVVVMIIFRDGERTIATYRTSWDNSAAHELLISRVFLPLTGT